MSLVRKILLINNDTTDRSVNARLNSMSIIALFAVESFRGRQ